MGGISRFFDGYDWEPIVLLDDPVEPNNLTSRVELAAMKNLINEHERLVEVKGGSMPFDSKFASRQFTHVVLTYSKMLEKKKKQQQ